MSEARLYYNHVVDSLPNKHDRDAIRKYVDELEQQNAELEEFLEETISMTDSFQTERDWREWREAAVKLLEETDGI